MNFVDIVFASLLANNLLFFHFLGLGEFLSEGGKIGVLRRTGVLAILLLAASVLFWVPDRLLLQPFHLEFLRTILLLGVLWLVTLSYSAAVPLLPGSWPQAREFVVHSFLTGAVVLTGTSSPDLLEVVTAALAVAVGYGGAQVLAAAVFRRLARERIPSFIQGLPLQLLTLGLVWLVLQGLSFAFAGKST